MGWRSGQTPSFWSAVVTIPSRRCRDCRANRDKEPVQEPAALAGSEPRGQQAIVDLPCHGEAVKRRGGEEKPRVVREPVSGRVDVSLAGIHDPIAIQINSSDFCGVGVVQALREGNTWLEGDNSLVDIQEDLVGQTAGDEPLAELPL